MLQREITGGLTCCRHLACSRKIRKLQKTVTGKVRATTDKAISRVDANDLNMNLLKTLGKFRLRKMHRIVVPTPQWECSSADPKVEL